MGKGKKFRNIKLVEQPDINVSGLGPSRTLKKLEIGKRPAIELGLLTVKELGMKARHKSYECEKESVIYTE